MARRATIKALEAFGKLDKTAYESLRQQFAGSKDHVMLAYLQGVDKILTGLDPVTQTLVDTLEKQRDKLEKDKKPISPIVALIKEYTSVNYADIGKGIDLEIKEGKAVGPIGKLTHNVVLTLEFKSLMASFAFAYVKPRDWELYTVNTVTRECVTLAMSSVLYENLPENTKWEITSPTVARQVSGCWLETHVRKTFETIAVGFDALVERIGEGKWVSEGGIGNPDHFRFGAYAMLHKNQTATAWRAYINSHHKLPDKIEYVRQPKKG